MVVGVLQPGDRGGGGGSARERPVVLAAGGAGGDAEADDRPAAGADR